jgi:hypothetical protein
MKKLEQITTSNQDNQKAINADQKIKIEKNQINFATDLLEPYQ